MNNFLEQTKNRYNTILNRLHNDIHLFSDTQMHWKVNTDTWSIAEVLQHIITADKAYLVPMREALQGADRNSSTVTYRPSFFARLFIYSLKPGRSKYGVPAVFKPDTSQIDATIRQKFADHLHMQIKELSDWQSYDINRLKMTSPANALVRISLGEALDVMITHAERHMVQVDRIIDHPQFPNA